MTPIPFNKAYKDYEFYRRITKGHLTMATEYELKLWEEWKQENGYDKVSVKPNISETTD